MNKVILCMPFLEADDKKQSKIHQLNLVTERMVSVYLVEEKLPAVKQKASSQVLMGKSNRVLL